MSLIKQEKPAVVAVLAASRIPNPYARAVAVASALDAHGQPSEHWWRHAEALKNRLT